ncbi:hypothetical protein D352_00777 [Enterococcus faecium LA4B-2]|nr:hypothetical protein D352_00777 [Enterococcus faecium LA4B-2]
MTEELAREHRLFGKRDCDTTCHSPFLIELSHLFSNFFLYLGK